MSGFITPVWEERKSFFLLMFTFYYVVSVRRCFFVFLVLGMGCVTYLWHSRGLQYNYSMANDSIYLMLIKQTQFYKYSSVILTKCFWSRCFMS